MNLGANAPSELMLDDFLWPSGCVGRLVEALLLKLRLRSKALLSFKAADGDCGTVGFCGDRGLVAALMPGRFGDICALT